MLNTANLFANMASVLGNGSSAAIPVGFDKFLPELELKILQHKLRQMSQKDILSELSGEADPDVIESHTGLLFRKLEKRGYGDTFLRIYGEMEEADLQKIQRAHGLNDQQFQILTGILKGHSVEEIAQGARYSENWKGTHHGNIRLNAAKKAILKLANKFGVSSRWALFVKLHELLAQLPEHPVDNAGPSGP